MDCLQSLPLGDAMKERGGGAGREEEEEEEEKEEKEKEEGGSTATHRDQRVRSRRPAP
jgi:hypothetical protein